jgi:hypothetical protein
MSYHDVPLICDPPPGPQWILRCSERLTREQALILRQAWESAVSDPTRDVIDLAEGLSVEVMPGRHEWPDAEFCAA